MKRGFTLIELLIVVSIIGLLASAVLVGLRGFRSAGRDARRLSDLQQTRNGLELYFNKCQYYPGAAAPTSPCGFPVDIFTPRQPDNWNNLIRALTGSGLSISVLPTDPSNVPEKSYMYIPDQDNANYVLRAELEDPGNPALKNDIDDANAMGRGVSCADAPIPYYCIGL